MPCLPPAALLPLPKEHALSLALAAGVISLVFTLAGGMGLLAAMGGRGHRGYGGGGGFGGGGGGFGGGGASGRW